MTFTPKMPDIPARQQVHAQVENKNGILPNKEFTASTTAAFANGRNFHKSGEVSIGKETSKNVTTSVYAGASRANDKTRFQTGIKVKVSDL